MMEDKKNIVFTSNHRIGSWAVSVLYRVAQTRASSDFKDYKKGGSMKKTTFFSNEDLDNILRGMEGLTTDEKEAYLDARLKELESLPDSRKKELQEAARAGMQPTLELASHISVMNELQRIGNIVSFASIAKDYFGKSKFWIHQRINGYLVNGKPACFTNEQIVRMAEALEDIAKQMQETAAHLKVIAAQERSTVKKLETGKE